jgi:tripartite-type tricarboxylate transporter receptor subunit TctC
MISRRDFLAGCSIASVAALSGAQGAGLVYPTRPITLIVPFAAGGPTDTLARIVADRMRVSLGQPIIVENTTGAGGTIAVGRVVRAAPDGYTIGIGVWNTHVLNGAIYSLPYSMLEDLEPIVLLANNSSLIVSRKDVPAQNLRDLITWVKANGEKISVGTAGAGTSTHVAGVLFRNLTGTEFQFVPYRGAAPAVKDLVSGQIDLMFDQISSALQYVRSGATKAYAIAAPQRSPIAPDIPTAEEAGLPGFNISVWHALWAPKGTPHSVIDRLNAAAVDALADPAVRERLAGLGQEIYKRERQTPGALHEFHKAEIEKWWPIIKAAGIKVD